MSAVVFQTASTVANRRRRILDKIATLQLAFNEAAEAFEKSGCKASEYDPMTGETIPASKFEEELYRANRKLCEAQDLLSMYDYKHGVRA